MPKQFNILLKQILKRHLMKFIKTHVKKGTLSITTVKNSMKRSFKYKMSL